MADYSSPVYPGRIVKANGVWEVKPFLFEGESPLLRLEGTDGSVNADDIVLYRAEGSDGRAAYAGLAARNGTALADLYRIAENNKVTIPYPDAVIGELRVILAHPGIDDPALADLRGKPFVTIDNEDSMDLDQALFIEENAGGFSIYYALADAAFYVRPGSALFEEALRRGTTYYFPGFSVPMLPAGLSEGLLSLNPDLDRRAFVFILEMDRAGEIVSSKCLHARIHSRAKLSYNGVQAYYDNPSASPLKGREFAPALDLLKKAGEIRIERDAKSHKVQFNRKETAISCTGDGSEFGITMDTRNDCSLYNEQLSLMCNMAGAQFLIQGSDPAVQGIFRIHESPEEKELDLLARTILEILESHGIVDPGLVWDRNRETLSAYMERLSAYHGNDRLADALERQVLLSMKRSVYTSVAGEHFALAVNPYSRFSSPMREIVGVFIHKEALEKLGLLSPAPAARDEELRMRVIESGNRSKALQDAIGKEVVKCAADRLFRKELAVPAKDRTRYCSTILGVQATRMYVRLDSPPLELKVYAEDLAGYLKRPLDFRKSCLVCAKTGEPLFRPGDKLDLCVDQYRADRWRLVPVDGR
jgi:ribonuclease R